ncbi:peptidase inhibitor family I36 protein [Streptomyces capoamus]|nr:peptidase inhibitor family I36 protein [Streptomyces capoamus]
MPFPCGHSSGDGDGQGVFNSAASAWNQDPYAAYSVYSQTGYSGESKWYPKADGYARNLGSGLKNHNGAHKRYS